MREMYRVVFFHNFGFSGYAESKIYACLFQKCLTDGPVHGDAPKMFRIKNVWYQRINCEAYFKLLSLKCKNAMSTL